MRNNLNRRTKDVGVVAFDFKGYTCTVRCLVSRITGNLHFAGTMRKVGGGSLPGVAIGFANRGSKRGTLGGWMVESDSLARSDEHPFVVAVAQSARWHGFKPIPRSRRKKGGVS